ncbi:prepilin peptidase CpaA [Formivibrio citricus]|uniref:Prepilin peptidase CpaA n=1 Tax=Formivibrio citricus TaxID=83765 RepID=A0A1I4WY93_9NEIS|nr:A24 family peptidase [Formivibrio citricus]SFN18537.1 prepilin peptidase CpaA [Formivibrio citricus]
MDSVKAGVLGLLLVIAAWGDIKRHRIPNILILTGLVLAILLGAWQAGFPGLLSAGGGFALGLAAFLPFYLLRALGAGDVKLMAVVGGFLGPSGLPGAILGTFLAGGVMALALALHAGKLGQMLKNIKAMLTNGMIDVSLKQMPIMEAGPQSVGKLPYAVAIATGTLGFLVLRYIGWM